MTLSMRSPVVCRRCTPCAKVKPSTGSVKKANSQGPAARAAGGAPPGKRGRPHCRPRRPTAWSPAPHGRAHKTHSWLPVIGHIVRAAVAPIQVFPRLQMLNAVDDIRNDRAGRGHFAGPFAVKDDIAGHIAAHKDAVKNVLHIGKLAFVVDEHRQTMQCTRPSGSAWVSPMSLTTQPHACA